VSRLNRRRPDTIIPCVCRFESQSRDVRLDQLGQNQVREKRQLARCVNLARAIRFLGVAADTIHLYTGLRENRPFRRTGAVKDPAAVPRFH